MTALELLVQCAGKGSLLLAAGFLASALLRQRSAALRHSVWTVCLATLLALPAAVVWLPDWHAPQRAPQVVEITEGGSLSSVPLPAPAVPKRRTASPVAIWELGLAAVALRFLLGMVRTSRMVSRATPDPAAAQVARSLGGTARVVVSSKTPCR